MDIFCYVQIYCVIQCFDEFIVIVWIVGKIGFVNVSDYCFGFDLISVNCCQCQKENIVFWYESIGDIVSVWFIVWYWNVILCQVVDCQFVQ